MSWHEAAQRETKMGGDRPTKIVHVRAPSRLHFGLLSVPATSDSGLWPNVDDQESTPARHFGGVGLMVDTPGIRVAARPSSEWSAEGPLRERALAFARQLASAMAVTPMHITVEGCPGEHIGLGTGTQLGLAVAKAVTSAAGIAMPDVAELARLVGRGGRSAIGVHGFASGGFLVEGGKRAAADLSPLIARLDFPDSWRILLILPRDAQGRHGANEQAVFVTQCCNLRNTEALCRLIVLGMLPALRDGDLHAFGETLYDFNRRAGEWFRRWQSGYYADPRAEAMVTFLRARGVRGAGQSSWGPALFAVTDDDPHALVKAVAHRFDLAADEIVITQANNHGARVEVEG
jgi:beta-ribofuranosylaminobenzene 5'-phosphate synthase